MALNTVLTRKIHVSKVSHSIQEIAKGYIQVDTKFYTPNVLMSRRDPIPPSFQEEDTGGAPTWKRVIIVENLLYKCDRKGKNFYNITANQK